MRLIQTAMLSLALTASAFGQGEQEAAAFYVPTGNAGDLAGKIVYPSGAEAPVVHSMGSNAPSDCPEGWFWVNNDLSLVSCSGETAYRFVPPSGEIAAISKGALGLELIKGRPPTGGTDKPPPMMLAPPSDGEVKP